MKKISTLLQLQLLIILRKKIWTVILSLCTLGAIILFCYVYKFEPYGAIRQTFYTQSILTLASMMIGIEMQREIVTENISLINDTYNVYFFTIPLIQIAAIAIVNGIVSLAITFGISIRMIVSKAEPIWIYECIKSIFILFFLSGVILGITGLLLGKIINSKNIYLPAASIWLITSSISIYFSSNTISSLSVWNAILNYFSQGMSNAQMFKNIFLSAEIESHKLISRLLILGILFFILLIAFYIRSNITKKKKILSAVSTIIVCFIIICFSISRYYVFFERFFNPEASLEYVITKSDKYIQFENTSANQFPGDKNITVNNVDINIECSTQGIKSEVEITATQNITCKYQSFTLYSDFEIDNIEVNGINCDFKRNLDGVLVVYPNNIQSNTTVVFKFNYHGYSLPSLPANETTVQLLGEFPWLPYPGLKTNDVASYFSETESFFVESWQQDKDVKYSITYNGPGNIYCNLSDSNNNHFSGYSDHGVTLFSGMYHEEYKDIDVYVPFSRSYEIKDLADSCLLIYEQVDDLCNKLNIDIDVEPPSAIILISVRTPIINYYPAEVYSINEQWEIRIRNEESAVVTINSLDPDEKLKMAKKSASRLFLNKCIGFPINLSYYTVEKLASFLDDIALSENETYSIDEFSEIYMRIISGENVSENDILNSIESSDNYGN